MRYTPTSIESTYAAITALNTNFADIQALFEKCVFTDGESPNSMLANLDLNHFTVQNLGAPANPNDAVRLSDLSNVLGTIDTDMAALAASGGAALIGSIGQGAGATARTVQAKLRDFVSVKDFGAVGDGVADDSAALQAALTSLGTAGGTVLIPSGCVLRLLNNVNVPDNCAIKGVKAVRPRTVGSPNLNLLSPRIVLSRTKTITLNNGSELENFFILPDAFTFSDTRANVDAWTGNAITFADNISDAVIKSVLIIGFNFGITTGSNTRIDRVSIDDVKLDCNNGIYLKNCFDIVYLSRIHGWPFSTLQSTPEVNNQHLKRSGTFIKLDGTTNDGAKVFQSFCYGMNVGFYAAGADSFSFTCCHADNDPGVADGTVGFKIDGGSFEGRLVSCQASGVDKGVVVDTTDTNGRVFINELNSWETKTYAVQAIHGDVLLTGGGLRNTGSVGTAIRCENTVTSVQAIGTKINGFSTAFHSDTSVPVVHDLCDFTGTTTVANTPYVKTIASASPFVTDLKSKIILVTGTTGFSTINNAGAYAGKTLTLKFGAALTLSTGGNLKLAGNVAFAATPDDTITFISDGTNFFEIARSVN
jgi:hypothetical protein